MVATTSSANWPRRGLASVRHAVPHQPAFAGLGDSRISGLRRIFLQQLGGEIDIPCGATRKRALTSHKVYEKTGIVGLEYAVQYPRPNKRLKRRRK
jgi:hypothetical protein